MMLYDAQRRRVTDDVVIDAKCADCGGDVIARRPLDRVWHWMHKGDRPPHCRVGGESDWHIKIKLACEDNGFQLEVPHDRWRFDAASAHNYFAVVEAVHSLSSSYYDKATALSGLGDRQLWILDDTVARTNSGLDANRHYGWTRLAEHLRSQGATVWFAGLVMQDYSGRDTFDHPDLLASLYARLDDAPQDEVRHELDRLIAKHRHQSGSLDSAAEPQTLESAAAAMLAEATSLRDVVVAQ